MVPCRTSPSEFCALSNRDKKTSRNNCIDSICNNIGITNINMRIELANFFKDLPVRKSARIKNKIITIV